MASTFTTENQMFWADPEHIIDSRDIGYLTRSQFCCLLLTKIRRRFMQNSVLKESFHLHRILRPF